MSTKNIVVPYAKLQQAFHTDPGKFSDTVYQSADQAANGDSAERARLIAAWNDAVSALHKADQGGVMSTAQNDVASRLQSLIAEKAAAAGQVVTIHGDVPVVTPAGGQSLSPTVQEVQFDNEDLLGWLGMAWKLIFKPDRHPWINPPATPDTIADNARIAVFADWGTGLYGAPAIAKSIVNLDHCDVVLHLGDTYYSGSDDEIRERLVGDWPVRSDSAVNRTLNGNHEMYSGGMGYFNALSSFFNQPASCFAMQNANWVLVCLDTAYVDFDLDPAQVTWLESIVAAAGDRKLILFSHHQPFS
jgi:hypothetical protein